MKPSRKKKLRSHFLPDLAVAFSFGYFFLLSEGTKFLFPEIKMVRGVPHFIHGLLGFHLAALILSAVVFLAIRQLTHVKKAEGLFYVVLIGLMMFPLNKIRTADNFAVNCHFISYTFWQQILGRAGIFSVVTLLFGGVIFAAWTKSAAFTRTSRAVFKAITPFVVLNWGIATYFALAHLITALPPIKRINPTAHQSVRTLLFVYDEMSESYLEKGGRTQFPALTRFREENFAATNATSPTSITKFSIPSYLTGEIPREALSSGISSDRVPTFLSPQELDHESFSRDSIFEDRHARGEKQAAIGWYFPYCSIFSQQLSACAGSSTLSAGFSNSVWNNARTTFHQAIAHPFRPRAAVVHSNQLEALNELLLDQTYRTIYVHWSLPHLPGIAGIASEVRNDETGYLANLKVVDDDFAAIRRRLEDHDLWKSTQVLLVSDHALHHYHCWKEMEKTGYDDRIPFLVKLDRETSPLSYPKRFNAIVYRKFANALIDGQFTSSDGIRRWLEHNGRDIARVDPVDYPCKPR